jgi:hypothetical protein
MLLPFVLAAEIFSVFNNFCINQGAVFKIKVCNFRIQWQITFGK